MRQALLITAIVTALAASACGKASTSAPATSPSSAPSQVIKAPGDAKLGDRTRCIVSGDVFKVTAASPHADYKGKTYYFCCSDCPEAFKKDPEKYVSQKGAQAS